MPLLHADYFRARGSTETLLSSHTEKGWVMVGSFLDFFSGNLEFSGNDRFKNNTELLIWMSNDIKLQKEEDGVYYVLWLNTFNLCAYFNHNVAKTKQRIKYFCEHHIPCFLLKASRIIKRNSKVKSMPKLAFFSAMKTNLTRDSFN